MAEIISTLRCVISLPFGMLESTRHCSDFIFLDSTNFSITIMRMDNCGYNGARTTRIFSTKVTCISQRIVDMSQEIQTLSVRVNLT